MQFACLSLVLKKPEMEVTILQLKQCWNTRIKITLCLRKKYFEFESWKDPNLQLIWNLSLRIFRLSFSYLKKCPPTLLQNRHWVEKIFCSLFSIFCLKSHHQIYSNVSKAKPLPLCNRCLFHITSCKRSFTSAFECVITSVPSAEQQSFYERSARVSSLVSFSHSGRVRSPFGIRRIAIPRPHKNQNARTSPVPRPTETRPRGLLVDQAQEHNTR